MVSSSSKGSRNANHSNHHPQENCRSGSGADAGSTDREGNEKRILLQIGGITCSYKVNNDLLETNTTAINGMQIFMASTSPSLSSLSSTSSDDMIELKAKEAKLDISYENNEQNRNLSDISSGLGELHGSPGDNTPRSEVSVVTNVSVGPAPLSPTQSPPLQVMDRDAYDHQRIPVSIFEESTGALDWSAASNESLFSLSIGDHSLAWEHGISLARDHDSSIARDHVFHYSDFISEEIPKSDELLAYCPSLATHLEDAEGETSDVDEQRSVETETTMKTDCEEKSSIPILSWRDLSESNNSDKILSGFHISDQTPTSLESIPSPITKRNKKKSKSATKKTKKKKKRCSWCCCFSCGNCCCCKSARACHCCCRWPTSRGGFSCWKWQKWSCCGCFSYHCCCRWPKWSCCDCFSCHCCCRWPKWSCCDYFSCRACCSCRRCCCCCCYSSSSLERTQGGDKGTEKNKGHRAQQKWFCCFPLCSWCCFCPSCS